MTAFEHLNLILSTLGFAEMSPHTIWQQGPIDNDEGTVLLQIVRHELGQKIGEVKHQIAAIESAIEDRDDIESKRQRIIALRDHAMKQRKLDREAN